MLSRAPFGIPSRADPAFHYKNYTSPSGLLGGPPPAPFPCWTCACRTAFRNLDDWRNNRRIEIKNAKKMNLRGDLPPGTLFINVDIQVHRSTARTRHMSPETTGRCWFIGPPTVPLHKFLERFCTVKQVEFDKCEFTIEHDSPPSPKSITSFDYFLFAPSIPRSPLKGSYFKVVCRATDPSDLHLHRRLLAPCDHSIAQDQEL